jgi:DDE superfamily endonuclease
MSRSGTAASDNVSLDNLASHKSKAVRDAIRAAGAKRIFLRAYSPDLNPIDPSAGSAGLRQAETSHAKSRRENHRRDMEPARNFARPLLAARMRKLFQERRIWFTIKYSRSSEQRPDLKLARRESPA